MAKPLSSGLHLFLDHKNIKVTYQHTVIKLCYVVLDGQLFLVLPGHSMAPRVLYIGEYTMILLSDFDYICHDTVHNHPKNNAKLSSSYL